VMPRRSRSRLKRGPTSSSTSGIADRSPMGATLTPVPENGNETCDPQRRRA
jgi:hypothetical protein